MPTQPRPGEAPKLPRRMPVDNGHGQPVYGPHGARGNDRNEFEAGTSAQGLAEGACIRLAAAHLSGHEREHRHADAHYDSIPSS